MITQNFVFVIYAEVKQEIYIQITDISFQRIRAKTIKIKKYLETEFKKIDKNVTEVKIESVPNV